MNRQDGALVIGGDYRALGVVRSLGRRGVPVWVVTNEHRIATASRYTLRHFHWPHDEAEQVQFLFQLCDHYGLERWALIPSDEEAAAFLARHYSALAERFLMATPTWDALQWGYDKRRTHQLACDLGIDVPRTYQPRTREELEKLECNFPVILKPAFKQTMNRFTHAKAWRCDDRDALLKGYDDACTLVDPDIILIQELIPGGGEAQLSYAALCLNGEPVASITARRTRQYPVDFGRASSYVESVDEPEVEAIARRLLKAIAFTGLVEVEFKRDPRDGTYKVLDINSRVWGWHTLAQRAGIDFPYLLWRLVHGFTEPNIKARAGIRWVRMLTDIPAAWQEMRQGRLSLRGYFRSLQGPLEFAIFAADDPMPAIAELPFLASMAWKRQRSGPVRTPSSRGMQVCMITHSVYEEDSRVLRYAQSLVQRGDSVEVFSLRWRPDLPKDEVVGGVKVHRIQDRFRKNAVSKTGSLLPVLRFFLLAACKVTRRHWRQRYDIVHVHNIPDFLVFAALYPKLGGAKIILDVHDMVPELFATKFNASPDSLWIRALKFMEKLSGWFADHVILSNHLWLEKYTSRTAPKSKCSVFINNVDRTIFQPAQRVRRDKPVIIFPGGLQSHQGVDIAIRAFAKLQQRMPHAEFHIYGDGPMKQPWSALAKELGVDGSVIFHEPLRLRKIAEVMSQADLGVVPKRADTFGNEAFSTKILEFMAVGVPVVASSTRIDRYYFDDSLVRFFPSGDAVAMADAMYEVLSNRDLQAQLVSRASEHAARNDWQSLKAEYLNLIDSLRAA
jgi:predicted ATP-grasp superfamily ATP-dependent carboligase/glycosyltransferase involved in cell wall biosynthesis